MKIIKIEKSDRIYSVTFKPNKLQALFGATIHTEKYKDTLETYKLTGHVYIDQEGRELGCTFGYGSDIREAIDRWRRKF